MTSAGFRFYVCAAGISLALANAAASQSGPVRIWKIGSPHRGDTPAPSIPPQVAREFDSRRLIPEVQSFPAREFFPNLKKAVDSGSPPDVLVIDNYGLIRGITTRLGRFPGIAQDQTIGKQLLGVKGSFDELLGSGGGWTYLLSGSKNYNVAREAALRAPDCGGRPAVQPTREFASVVAAAATAYMRGDAAVLDRLADPERMAALHPAREPAQTRDLRICGVWGHTRLTIVSMEVSFEADSSIGHSPVLLVFRKPASQWQLLVASLDPISNREFVKTFLTLRRLIEGDAPGTTVMPVVLRAPADGLEPTPVGGTAFGDFEWDAPQSDGVLDIAEFAYLNDARLFVVPRRPKGVSGVSSGRLWHTRSEWKWRIWSLTRDGELVFSETRTFTH
ncbi:MAG: hypothetical protein EHM55_05285 [Acidobacteria bacterium]|nr:MAG: hypothetical protein EHM55_05285 [Acidobacteriota bacterium]